MRQPKFLRHLVEKFLLKGDEGNANLQPGIMPVWETQPLGVTRLPEVPCKIFESGALSADRDFTGLEVNEPLNFSGRARFTVGGSFTIFSNIPVGTIFRWKFGVAIEDGLLTGPITWTGEINISVIGTTIFETVGIFNAECICSQFFDSGWIFSQHPVDLVTKVATLNPASQSLFFSSQLCLYPNRELC